MFKVSTNCDAQPTVAPPGTARPLAESFVRSYLAYHGSEADCARDNDYTVLNDLHGGTGCFAIGYN